MLSTRFLQRKFLNINLAKTFCFQMPPKFNIIVDQDLTIARKQVSWRIRNMGQLEFEVIFGKWYEANYQNLTRDDLAEFAKEVLELEIPKLQRILMNQEPMPENANYLKKIKTVHGI